MRSTSSLPEVGEQRRKGGTRARQKTGARGHRLPPRPWSCADAAEPRAADRAARALTGAMGNGHPQRPVWWLLAVLSMAALAPSSHMPQAGHTRSKCAAGISMRWGGGALGARHAGAAWARLRTVALRGGGDKRGGAGDTAPHAGGAGEGEGDGRAEEGAVAPTGGDVVGGGSFFAESQVLPGAISTGCRDRPPALPLVGPSRASRMRAHTHAHTLFPPRRHPGARLRTCRLATNCSTIRFHCSL